MSHEADYFQALLTKTEQYLHKLGIEAVVALPDSGSKVKLDDYTAFIQVAGVIQGGFILTMETALAVALAQKYMLHPITREEAAGYAVEVVAEIANVITGNALSDREEHDIFLGNPLMIMAKHAEIRAKSKTMYLKRFATASGTLVCLYIPMEDGAELASIFTVELENKE